MFCILLDVFQVLKFVVAHADVFLAMLREKNANPTLESLEELSLATAVVCRAAVCGMHSHLLNLHMYHTVLDCVTVSAVGWT